MGNKAKLILSATEDNVAVARITAAAFCGQMGFTVSEVEEIKVAVSEGITNAIIHGYNSDSEREVILELIDDDNTLVVNIIDEGVGIEDVEKAKEATYTTVDGRMGLGFVFMSTFSDEMEVVSEVGEGTIVTLKKRPSLL